MLLLILISASIFAPNRNLFNNRIKTIGAMDFPKYVKFQLYEVDKDIEKFLKRFILKSLKALQRGR